MANRAPSDLTRATSRCWLGGWGVDLRVCSGDRAPLRTFVDAGGHLLLSTDVGYMDDYDTIGELDALSDRGLGAGDILRMLTTEP